VVSQDHTLVKEDNETENYMEDMKKGTSNILVLFQPIIRIGGCQT
jgi:hypothetical protein